MIYFGILGSIMKKAIQHDFTTFWTKHSATLV